ncbi:MAG: hypothetical protein BroJett005_11600 [Ignavibacteriota bacterium]|nr:MAG: hypothetical protein BroJett005_11600 [Ignavibacteriota bacterium]
MTTTIISPEDLDPKDKSKNKNLQNHSEENTGNENIEKKTLIHQPGLIQSMWEEAERKEAESIKVPKDPVEPKRDPRVWEHISEEDDTTPAEGGEDNVEQPNEQDPSEDDEKRDAADQLNQSAGRRHLRKDNRKISDLKRTQKQKQKKQERLVNEINKLKADLDRGYLMVPLAEGSDNMKHVKLNKSDREIIEAAVAYKEYDNYETGLDIGEIEQKIIDLATKKKSSYKDKLNKLKKDSTQDKLIKQISKSLDGAKANGSAAMVKSIQSELEAGKKNEAYKSLKSFLSKNLKTVSKKLSKSAEMEQKVLDRVLDKITPSES